MRHARRATLLVAFYLLTSAATAYAECTWVLWDRDWIPVPGGVSEEKMWIVVSGHQNLPDCEVKRTKLAKDLEWMHKEYDKRTGAKASESEPYVPALVCLPDTVDPRGPKG